MTTPPQSRRKMGSLMPTKRMVRHAYPIVFTQSTHTVEIYTTSEIPTGSIMYTIEWGGNRFPPTFFLVNSGALLLGVS